jgi:hypothetical protein
MAHWLSASSVLVATLRAHLLSHVAYHAFKCEYCVRPSKRAGDPRRQ